MVTKWTQIQRFCYYRCMASKSVHHVASIEIVTRPAGHAHRSVAEIADRTRTAISLACVADTPSTWKDGGFVASIEHSIETGSATEPIGGASVKEMIIVLSVSPRWMPTRRRG